MKKFKKIGDFEVNQIGIGTAGVGRNDEKDIEAIRYSLSKGQNHIDTAELYENGHSEEIVAEVVKGYKREKLFVATKVWRNHATSDGVLRAIEGSLKRLNVGYVNLLYIHACWDEDKIDEYIKGLNRAQEKGFTRSIGVSNFDLKQLKKAVSLTKLPIVALQNHYNVNHKTEIDEKIRMFCKKNKITIVAYSPLENVFENSLINKVAEKYDKTPAQIALNWLIMQENVVTIPKSTDKKHIDENLGALEFEMVKEDLERLNDLK